MMILINHDLPSVIYPFLVIKIVVELSRRFKCASSDAVRVLDKGHEGISDSLYH